jgi:hypothetical protein
MDTTQAFAVGGIIATNLVTIITLYMHLDNKTDKTLRAISEEMRDFHGRLERQDAEFKGKLLVIEERMRK